MKQRRLKGYVLPTIYLIVLMIIFGTVSLISTVLNENPNYLYSTGILKGEVKPVVNVEGNITEGIIKPYQSEKVTIDKYFYDIEDSEERQINSLITFQDTYMKNTGILYTSEEEFEALMVLDGTILSIKDDEILGTVVEIENSPNLRTVYYSITNISAKEGDFLNQGEVIGVSHTNKISEANYNLLFEVYYNGTLINPETFYEMDISSLD